VLLKGTRIFVGREEYNPGGGIGEPIPKHDNSLYSIQLAVSESARSDALDRVRLDGYRESAVFGPGIAEQLVIMINPENNTRRNSIHPFVPARCSEGV